VPPKVTLHDEKQCKPNIMKSIFILLITLTIVLETKASSSSDSTEFNKTEKADQNSIKHPLSVFTTEASYTGDICTNMIGGIKTGIKYLGMANLKIGFDTQQARLWKGGTLFVNGAVTHGQSATELLIGDFQTVSNIDAGDRIYLHEFWYKQQYKSFEITFGLQDLNIEFASSNNGSMFINSSFGIPPVISDNIPAPIFPLTALGITTKIRITDKILLSAAIYDGSPTSFEHNIYNTNWKLCTEDGSLILGQLDWSTELLQLQGTYKAGYYFHTGLNETNTETGETTEVFAKNYGVYFIADQTIWENANNNHSIGVFAQLALSPANINNHNYYFGGGINYSGISKKQHEDALGIAFACAGFDKSYKQNETTIEAYYKKQISENFSIQPDLQYVIHPAGTDEVLPNALVGLLRFNLNF
jgi:porin